MPKCTRCGKFKFSLNAENLCKSCEELKRREEQKRITLEKRWLEARIAMDMKRLHECVHLVNTTTKPDVFFRRLHFLLDLLLDLCDTEKHKSYKQGETPTDNFNRIVGNLEATVNDFIDRAVADEREKINSLKTQKAKINRAENFEVKMLAAFDVSHSFWSGDNVLPHYTGPLFTEANTQYLEKALANLLEESNS